MSSSGNAEIYMMQGRTFWPIAQRVKQGRQLKNVSVNDSNFNDGLRNVKDGGSVDSNDTEGVPSLPPVDSQDTAYEPKSKVTDRYANRHVPGRTRSNVKEGGSILEVTMDDDDDYFSETGLHYGSILEVTMDDDDDYFSETGPHYPTLAIPPFQMKGFQHLYKSTKTTSSGRVFASHKETTKHGFLCNDHARRNDKKNRKIRDLQKVKPSPQHMMNMSNDTLRKDEDKIQKEQHSTQCSCLWKEYKS